MLLAIWPVRASGPCWLLVSVLIMPCDQKAVKIGTRPLAHLGSRCPLERRAFWSPGVLHFSTCRLHGGLLVESCKYSGQTFNFTQHMHVLVPPGNPTQALHIHVMVFSQNILGNLFLSYFNMGFVCFCTVHLRQDIHTLLWRIPTKVYFSVYITVP